MNCRIVVLLIFEDIDFFSEQTDLFLLLDRFFDQRDEVFFGESLITVMKRALSDDVSGDSFLLADLADDTDVDLLALLAGTPSVSFV